MGEKIYEVLKLQFDKRLRLEFHGGRDYLRYGTAGLSGTGRGTGVDGGGRNVQHELVPLLRQSAYSRLAGYEDTNDAVRLAREPAMQAVFGRRALEKQAASNNTFSRFDTEVLVTEENLRGLERLNVYYRVIRSRGSGSCNCCHSL